jgi:hypothetical protein
VGYPVADSSLYSRGPTQSSGHALTLFFLVKSAPSFSQLLVFLVRIHSVYLLLPTTDSFFCNLFPLLYFATVMALLSLLFVFAVLCVLTLWKRLTRKDKIPPGLKKLPGPKGTSAMELMFLIFVYPLGETVIHLDLD